MTLVNRYRHLLELFPRLTSVESRLILVDVGCGVGRLIQKAGRAYPHWILCGLDPMEVNCKATRGMGFPGMDIRCESIQAMSFANQFADITVCSDVLEHLWERDHHQAASELKRITKPRGLLVVTTPGLRATTSHMRSLGHVSYLSAEYIRGLFLGCDLVYEGQVHKKALDDPTQIMIFRMR